MNTDSDEEKIVNYNVALCAQDSMSLEKMHRRLKRDIPSGNVNNTSQSHNERNEISCKKVINNETHTVQGPTSYNKEIELQRAWTMQMPMMDGDISNRSS